MNPRLKSNGTVCGAGFKYFVAIADYPIKCLHIIKQSNSIQKSFQNLIWSQVHNKYDSTTLKIVSLASVICTQ